MHPRKELVLIRKYLADKDLFWLPNERAVLAARERELAFQVLRRYIKADIERERHARRINQIYEKVL